MNKAFEERVEDLADLVYELKEMAEDQFGADSEQLDTLLNVQDLIQTL